MDKPSKGAGVSEDPRKALGNRAERLAEEHLRAKGYEILRRNYRTNAGEVDLIAARKGVLVFVEVRSKTTPEFGSPLESLGPGKLRRIARAAKHYLAVVASKDGAEWDARFDVVAVDFTEGEEAPKIEHLESAFDLPAGMWQ